MLCYEADESSINVKVYLFRLLIIFKRNLVDIGHLAHLRFLSIMSRLGRFSMAYLSKYQILLSFFCSSEKRSSLAVSPLCLVSHQDRACLTDDKSGCQTRSTKFWVSLLFR